MKTNSKCKGCKIYNKLINSNINYKKNYWIFLTIPLALILVSLIVFAFVSFNFTFNITGGKVISIDYGTTMSDDKYVENEKIVNKILADAGVKKYTIERVGVSGNYSSIVKIITTRIITVEDATIEKVADQISDEFEEGNPGFELINTTSQAFAGDDVMTYFIIAFAVLLVLSFGYIWFRYGIIASFATVMALIFGVAITCAFAIISRIPTDEYFIVILIGVATLITYFLVYKLNILQQNELNEENKSETNNSLMNMTRKQTMKSNMLVYTSFLLIIAVLMVFGANSIRFIVLHLFFSLIACAYVTSFVFPAIWTLLYNRKNNKILIDKLKKIEASKDNQKK